MIGPTLLSGRNPSGIRHPILDQPNVDEADARFTIVTCTAVVNWIIAKAEKTGVSKA